MIRSKEFPMKPYSSWLVVIVGKASGWELYDHMASAYSVEMPKLLKVEEDWAGCCFYKDSTVVVWVANHKDYDGKETVVHELFHATRKVMGYAAIRRLNKENEECWAYLIGHMFHEVAVWLKL